MSNEKQIDLFEPHDMIPDFGEWKVVKRCEDCKGMTIHVRSVQKVSYGWIFRCTECGKIVGAGIVR